MRSLTRTQSNASQTNPNQSLQLVQAKPILCIKHALHVLKNHVLYIFLELCLMKYSSIDKKNQKERLFFSL